VPPSPTDINAAGEILTFKLFLCARAFLSPFFPLVYFQSQRASPLGFIFGQLKLLAFTQCFTLILSRSGSKSFRAGACVFEHHRHEINAFVAS